MTDSNQAGFSCSLVSCPVTFVSLCLWLQALSPSDKKCFEDMAKADKVRYNREMKDYVPPKGFGKRGRKRKDPNAPKRPP